MMVFFIKLDKLNNDHLNVKKDNYGEIIEEKMR